MQQQKEIQMDANIVVPIVFATCKHQVKEQMIEM